MGLKIRLGDLRRGARLPGDLDTLRRAIGRRIALGDDHHPAGNGVRGIIERDGFEIPLHRAGGAVIHRDDGRAVARRREDRPRIDHAGHFGVDAIDGTTVDLVRHIERGDGLADEAALGDRFDRQCGEFLGREAPVECAFFDDLSIADRFGAGAHDAVARGAGRRFDLKEPRALLDQREPTRRTGAAERGEALPDRPAAARDHGAPFGIGIDVENPHFVPLHFQLIGKNARERGADMLAHFGADHMDRHHAGAVHREPECRLEDRPFRDRRQSAFGSRIIRCVHRHGNAEGKASRCRDDEEAPAREAAERGVSACKRAHYAFAFMVVAARWIAARMRG
jgi:hypothetical protein